MKGGGVAVVVLIAFWSAVAPAAADDTAITPPPTPVLPIYGAPAGEAPFEIAIGAAWIVCGAAPDTAPGSPAKVDAEASDMQVRACTIEQEWGPERFTNRVELAMVTSPEGEAGVTFTVTGENFRRETIRNALVLTTP